MPKGIDWEAQIGRRLRLRDLHAFFTVARCGSMAKAAQQLGVSQPAISKVMADLERALAVRLLDRNRRGVTPTIYGDALLRRGLIAFDELKQSVKEIEFLADPASGEIRIECPETISATLLPRIIERFSKQYPRVVVHVDGVLTPIQGLPALFDRKYDLLFGRLSVPLDEELRGDDWNIETLYDDHLVVAAGARNRWTRRRKIDLPELAGEPWILSPLHTSNYARLAQAFKAQALDMPKASLVTLSMPLIIHFLRNGPYITAYPRTVTRLNSLAELPVDLPVQPWPVAMVTLKNRTLSPVVERFIACARELATPFAT